MTQQAQVPFVKPAQRHKDSINTQNKTLYKQNKKKNGFSESNKTAILMEYRIRKP